jgi:hypothetical protein
MIKYGVKTRIQSSLFVHGLTLSRKEINPPFISGGQNVGNSCLGVASGCSAADQCQVPRLCHNTTVLAFYGLYKRLHFHPRAHYLAESESACLVSQIGLLNYRANIRMMQLKTLASLSRYHRGLFPSRCRCVPECLPFPRIIALSSFLIATFRTLLIDLETRLER